MERIRFILDCPNSGRDGESLRPKRFVSAIVDEAQGFDGIEDAEICSMGDNELDEWIFEGHNFGQFANSESQERFNLRKENTRGDIAKPNRLTQLDE